MEGSSSVARQDDNLTLSLRLATHPVLGSNTVHPLTSLPRTASILNLKQRLEDSWDGKPRKEGITVVKGGRVLRDAEVVGEVFEEELKQSPVPELVLHVIVRPTAWSQPFSTPAAPSSAANTSSLSSPSPPIPLPTAAFTSGEATDVLASTPLPSPGIGEAASPLPAATPASSPPPPPPTDSLPPTPTIRETPPTPVPTPPQREGYAPAYLSSSPSPAAAPSPSAAPSSPPSAAPLPSIAQQPGAGAGASPFLPYLSHLQRLIPLQRALLLLNLQKAHMHYQGLVSLLNARLARGGAHDEGQGEVAELGEVEELFKGLGLWGLVEQAEKAAEKEYEDRVVELAGAVEAAPQEEFRVVQLNGLPYLLHTPPNPGASPPPPHLPTLLRLRCAQTIHHTLTTLLQVLITFQPSVAAIAHGRAGPGVGGGQAAAGAIRQGYRPMQPAPPGAAQQQAAAVAALAAAAGVPIPGAPPAAGAARVRRGATLSITLNVDTLLSLLIPLFFLSLKLAFLLWIFGRHASTTKRIVLAVMAACWVGYEGWRLLNAAGRQRRRAGGGGGADQGGAGGEQIARGDRERQAERERRRAVRAANAAAAAGQQPGQPAPVPGQPVQAAPTAAAGQGQGQVAVPAPPLPQPRQRRRSPPPSLLSPKYWLNALAAVGLVDEARELGLQPRFIAGRPIPPAPTTPPSPLKRALKNVWVGMVLFVGTLSPEVERKRKRALEKRERLVRERREAAERARALEVVQREREEMEKMEKEEARKKRAKEQSDIVAAFRARHGTPNPTPAAASTSTSTSFFAGSPFASSSSTPPAAPFPIPAPPAPESFDQIVARLRAEGTPKLEAEYHASEELKSRNEERKKKGFWEYEIQGERAVMEEARRRRAEEREKKEKERKEEEKRMRREGAEGEGGKATEVGEEKKLGGRQKVSDEELFRDGEGVEAYASSPSPPPVASTSSSSATAVHSPPSAPTLTAPPDNRNDDEDDPLDLDGDGEGSSASSTAGDQDEGRAEGAPEGRREGAAGAGDEEGEVDQVVALF